MKNKFFTYTSLALAGATLLAACQSGSTPSSSLADNKTYNLSFSYIDGRKAKNVEITLSSGESSYKGTTDNNGEVSIEAPEATYNVSTLGALSGYRLEETTLSELSHSFTLTSSVITDYLEPSAKYNLGDVIYDYGFTTSDGRYKSIASELETKKMVFINFWYDGCSWCETEFPFMEESYEKHSNDVSIFALSISDTNSEIASYKKSRGLTFDMGHDDPSSGLTNRFEYSGFPFSVVIDRYGRVDHIKQGAIKSTDSFDELFDYYCAENYVPENPEESGGVVYPDVTMPSSEAIAAVINAPGFDGTYRPETNDDAALSWPFVISEDGTSIHPSNKGIGNSFAILYVDIHLQKDQCFAFDYLCSTEAYCDKFYVLVDKEVKFAYSGIETEWKTSYAFVAEKEADYEIAFCYFKDEDANEGQDTVYVRNFRYLSTDEILEPTYVLRNCADGEIVNGRWSSYSTVVYNEEDGYYHVDSLNGPIVLANINDPSHFSQYSLYDYMADGYLKNIDGKDYTDLIKGYATLAGSTSVGYCCLTKELKEAFDAIVSGLTGVTYEEQFLELCVYYNAYGTGGVEMKDPTEGVSIKSALTAHEGDQNFANIDHVIMPRGIKFRFEATADGVYQFNSIGNKETDCFIYDENGRLISQSDEIYRRSVISVSSEAADPNFYDWVYMEKGDIIYIAVAFWDLYEFSTLQFAITNVGESYDVLMACSPGYCTTDGVDADGNPSGELVRLGIDVEIDSDGYYREKRADGSLGSYIYCDFSGLNQIFQYSLQTIMKDPIRGFDCTVDELGNPVTGGVDYTSRVKTIVNNTMILDDGETMGCVKVTEELGVILQAFMDKYYFKVNESWLKVCYYFNHYGK